MKSEAEAAVVLAGFESESDAFADAVRGVSVWRLIRFAVGLTLQDLPFTSRPLPRGELFRATLRSLLDMATPPRGRYAVKSYISALRIAGQTGYEDIYFGSLLDAVPGGIRLHSLNAAGYAGRTCCSPAPAVDCTAVAVLGAVLARLFPIREGNAVYARLAKSIEQRLGIKDFPAVRIRRMFSSFWWQSRIYRWLLRRIRVNDLLVADTGERAMLLACKDIGVRFVELQHGIFTPDHPDALPAAVLDSADEKGLLLPDVVGLYGSYWLERLAGTALGRADRLASVGAAIVERFRETRARNFRPMASRPRLVVTTQGIDREALIHYLRRFLELYREDCLLTVKLHPAFDDSAAPYIRMLAADDRVRIVLGSEDPNTYELIADSDVHLSIASACHYDALGIGTPTVVIGLAGHWLVQGLVDGGDALLAHNPEELAAIVSRRDWKPVEDAVSDKYYRHGFVDNVRALLV